MEITLEEGHEYVRNSKGEVVGTRMIPSNDPDTKSTFTRLEFRNRFTLAEKTAMYESTNTVVKIFLDDLAAAQSVDIEDQNTVDAVNYLASIGLLTEARATEILTPDVIS